MKLTSLKTIFIIIIINAFLCFCALAYKCNYENNYSERISYVCKDPIELSEWQIFIIALMEVECDRNPLAISSKNAVGPLQLTEIYIKEVNRLYNSNYTIEDAYDIDSSLTIVEMMNDYYNPNKDIDKAIKLHNPNAGSWYSKRIKDRMDKVRFNEQFRQTIINLYNY